jgi:hypothetical protein
MELQKDIREFIELLIGHEVKYVLVGGYAVAYHGYPRYTGDIDFFVERSPENALKLEQVVADFGFAEIGITAPDFLVPERVVQLGVPPNRIDVLTSLAGVNFEDALATSELIEVDGMEVRVISRELLTKNKKEVGRPKDLVDLDYL